MSPAQIFDELLKSGRFRLIRHEKSPSRSFAEINLRSLACALIRFKVRLLLKSHEPGHQHGGEAIARRVVILRRVGVVMARRSQTVFGSRQYILQLQETFVRFQLRIVLSNRKKASARAEQTAV